MKNNLRRGRLLSCKSVLQYVWTHNECVFDKNNLCKANVCPPTACSTESCWNINKIILTIIILTKCIIVISYPHFIMLYSSYNTGEGQWTKDEELLPFQKTRYINWKSSNDFISSLICSGVSCNIFFNDFFFHLVICHHQRIVLLFF